jgi:hypothetical protein
MYILTKRSAPNEEGKFSHHVYGSTPHIAVARAWFRATRVTDVFDCTPQERTTSYDDLGFYLDGGQDAKSIIRDTQMESWREGRLRQEKELAAKTG